MQFQPGTVVACAGLQVGDKDWALMVDAFKRFITINGVTDFCFKASGIWYCASISVDDGGDVIMDVKDVGTVFMHQSVPEIEAFAFPSQAGFKDLFDAIRTEQNHQWEVLGGHISVVQQYYEKWDLLIGQYGRSIETTCEDYQQRLRMLRNQEALSEEQMRDIRKRADLVEETRSQLGRRSAELDYQQFSQQQRELAIEAGKQRASTMETYAMQKLEEAERKREALEQEKLGMESQRRETDILALRAEGLNQKAQLQIQLAEAKSSEAARRERVSIEREELSRSKTHEAEERAREANVQRDSIERENRLAETKRLSISKKMEDEERRIRRLKDEADAELKNLDSLRKQSAEKKARLEERKKIAEQEQKRETSEKEARLAELERIKRSLREDDEASKKIRRDAEKEMREQEERRRRFETEFEELRAAKRELARQEDEAIDRRRREALEEEERRRELRRTTSSEDSGEERVSPRRISFIEPLPAPSERNQDGPAWLKPLLEGLLKVRGHDEERPAKAEKREESRGVVTLRREFEKLQEDLEVNSAQEAFRALQERISKPPERNYQQSRAWQILEAWGQVTRGEDEDGSILEELGFTVFSMVVEYHMMNTKKDFDVQAFRKKAFPQERENTLDSLGEGCRKSATKKWKKESGERRAVSAKCHGCGKVGHYLKDCRSAAKSRASTPDSNGSRSSKHTPKNQKGSRRV